MRLNIAECRYSKLRSEIVGIINGIQMENQESAEILIASIVEGAFVAVRRETSFYFRELVGAAAHLVTKAAEHNEDCECETCGIKRGLVSAIGSMEEVIAAQDKVGDDLLHTRVTGKGRDWLTVQREMAPDIIKALAAEHHRALRNNEY